MIRLYYWPTPNGHKITLLLEESGLPYELVPVDIGRGEQFAPDFLALSPNNRIPAMVDTAPADGGAPLSVFESGAILLYLAGKCGRFLPGDLRGRSACMEWLFWQVGGLGPMLGQNHHFNVYAPERIPYAMERYTRETERLYCVLDTRLWGRRYLCGEEYTLADMAAYPWIVPWQRQRMQLSDFPDLARWFGDIAARPATQRAYAQGERFRREGGTVDEKARAVLFGQSAATLRASGAR